MTLQFTAVQSSMESEDGSKKWYPRLVKVGRTVTSDDLAKDLARVSTLSVGDSRNVFDNLSDIFRTHLLNSRSVRLDGLGTFTVTCKAQGTGVDTREEVSSDQITSLKIRFTPCYTRSKYLGTTRALFFGVDFEMYGSKSKSTGMYAGNNNDTNTGNGGDTGGGSNTGGGGFVDPTA